MGGVFLRRRSAARAEAINDMSRDVAGLFRILQRHYQAFMDMLKWQVTSRAEFERLAGVVVDCLPWEAFITRWDRSHTLFYVDPPYWGTEHYYGRGMFERSDHERLAAALKGLRGRFILSLNDCPEVRELYKWAVMEEANLTYSAGGAHHSQPARELIIGPWQP